LSTTEVGSSRPGLPEMMPHVPSSRKLFFF
jgi:hypothetical protein